MIELVRLPDSWPREALDELCEIRGGVPAPQEDAAFADGKIPFVRMKDVGRHHFTNNLRETDQALNRTYFEKARYELIPRGSILMPRSGSVALNHRAILNVDAVIVSHLCALIPKSKRVTTDFLYRFLCLADMRKLTKRTTGLDSIAFSDLRMVAIPVPPLPEQQRIAGILEKAEALRAKRRVALAKIDILPQAIFLELFGDPTSDNSMRLDDIADLKRGPFGGALKKEIFVDAGYKVYEQKNAIQNDFTIGGYFISERKYREMEAFAIAPDDLIVSCSGTLGRVAVVPQNAAPGVINQALLRIRPDTKRATSVFLKHALEQPKVQANLVGFSHGTGLQNFPPMAEVRVLRVQAAPMHLQHDFARRVSAVEKLKATQHASLAKLDALFVSLQHRAFCGEL